MTQFAEGVEALGGNGYIEDWPMARVFRDAQVLPIWEGTTNILVLDTFRAIRKEDPKGDAADDKGGDDKDDGKKEPMIPKSRFDQAVAKARAAERAAAERADKAEKDLKASKAVTGCIGFLRVVTLHEETGGDEPRCEAVSDLLR